MQVKKIIIVFFFIITFAILNIQFLLGSYQRRLKMSFIETTQARKFHPIINYYELKILKYFLALASSFGNAYAAYSLIMLVMPDLYLIKYIVGFISFLLGYSMSKVMIVAISKVALESKAEGREIKWWQPFKYGVGVTAIRFWNIVGMVAAIYGLINVANEHKLIQQEIANLDKQRYEQYIEQSNSIIKGVQKDLSDFKRRTIISKGYNPALSYLSTEDKRRRFIADSLAMQTKQSLKSSIVFDNLLIYNDIAKKFNWSAIWLILLVVLLIPISIDSGLEWLSIYDALVNHVPETVKLVNDLNSEVANLFANLDANLGAKQMQTANGATSNVKNGESRGLGFDPNDPVNKAIALIKHTTGLSNRQIAKRAGKSSTTVDNIVKSYGIQ